MKKNFIIPIFLLAAIGFSVQKSGKFNTGIIQAFHVKNGGGSGPGKSGAPGEQNCTQCHSGTVQDGSTENILTVLDGTTPVTSYIPGNSYTVSLVMNSNPAKKGFQSTVLDGSDQMAGNFTVGTNTAISGTTRKYANHKSTSNTNATSAWSWNWTAPSTNVGDVIFYVASNKANNNNGDSGDMIYLSQHTIAAQSSSGLIENKVENKDLVASYDAVNNKIALKFNSMFAGEMTLNLTDLNGRSVMLSELGTSMIGNNVQIITLPSDLKNGVYLVNLFINNKVLSKKISILR
jgi:methionine-rich copper-binding protein CopC